MSVTELETLPEVRVGHVDAALVTVWYSQATLRGLEALARQQRALAAVHGKVTNVSVALKIPRTPGPDAQEWLRKNDDELTATSRGTVVVVLERGLGAILARSFIAAASLIARNTIHAVKTIEEAAERVKAMPGQAPALVADGALAAKLAAFAALPPPKS